MIQAILFDFNGVIIDDEPIHQKAYREVLAAHGVSQTEEEYLASLGMDDVTFVRASFERAKKPLTDETMREVIESEAELHRRMIADDLPISSGIVTFLKHVSHFFTLGLVSMATRSSINYALGLAHLEEVFSVIVSAEDVPACKPDPCCYERALQLINEHRREARQLPLLAKECLVVEDSPPGIESGRAAGMRTLGITNTVSEAALRAAGADSVTHSLADWNADAVHHVFD